MDFGRKKKDWEFSQEVLEEGEEILYENPERGWYEIYTFPVEEKIDPQELKWSLHEQETLALVLLDLQKFREKPLDEQAIYNIKTILYFFASHKKDVILRPVYDREGKGLEAEPESFELVLTHLIQIGGSAGKREAQCSCFSGLSGGKLGRDAYLGISDGRTYQTDVGYAENTYHRQDSCGSADTGTVAYFDPGREISETGMEGFRSV